MKFSEIRRLNDSKVKLKEITVINSTKDLLDLYEKLNDKQFARSAPIPVLEDHESFIVIKPQLKLKFGDIEVDKMEQERSLLKVYYKETENQEYLENRQNDPIVIFKVLSQPTIVKLIPTK
ncbi:hypothetical protein VUJ46_22435 [Chryseobacterium sp. MYb264]|uniref:hypothetical protein n=1 Tax=Chryseobacterium sp. MYb264 TaxID=2745153 RepID=UPI002E15CD78|nr:hypothetical protein VUJ46_22435 [Chryseobacterium sp. MYb264]